MTRAEPCRLGRKLPELVEHVGYRRPASKVRWKVDARTRRLLARAKAAC